MPRRFRPVLFPFSPGVISGGFSTVLNIPFKLRFLWSHGPASAECAVGGGGTID